MPMKKFFAIVALGTFVSAPAFAQHDPNDPNDPGAHHGIRAFDQRHSRIPLYAGDIYYEGGHDPNPDSQLDRSWWKRHERKQDLPSRPVERK
jgi:hypothetical protein